MADFTDKAALGTSRVNPSSMVPGATGNAPQGGFATQLRRPASAPQSAAAQQSQAALLAKQLGAQTAQIPRLAMPQRPTQSDLPAQTQSMLPGQSESDQKKNRSYKKEDFQLLSDVFKTLSER